MVEAVELLRFLFELRLWLHLTVCRVHSLNQCEVQSQ